MIYKEETILLNGAAPDIKAALYLLDNSDEVDANRARPLVIICPGGGYGFRSFRESEPVAVRLLSMGYHAAVLHYDVAPTIFPAQLLQLLATIHHLRQLDVVGLHLNRQAMQFVVGNRAVKLNGVLQLLHRHVQAFEEQTPGLP